MNLIMLISKLIFSSKENLLKQLVIAREVLTTELLPYLLMETTICFDKYVITKVLYEACAACV